MCRAKAKGGRRCRGVSAASSLPPMPADYEPERSDAHRAMFPEIDDRARRLFWAREQGYSGPIDQDGHAREQAGGGR